MAMPCFPPTLVSRSLSPQRDREPVGCVMVKFARFICPRVDRPSLRSPGPCAEEAAVALQAGRAFTPSLGLPEVSRPASQAVLRRPRSRWLLPCHSDFPSATSSPAPTTPAQLSCPAPWAQAASLPLPSPAHTLPATRTPLPCWPRWTAPGRSFRKDGRAGQQAAGIVRSQGPSSSCAAASVAPSCAISRWTCQRDGGHMAGRLPDPRDGLSAFHF